METIVIELNKILEDIMGKMEVLEGTEFAECKDDVRIEMSNRFEDLKEMIEKANKEGKVNINPKSLILTHGMEDKLYRVCFTQMRVAGSGIEAAGGVGVAWAEKSKLNLGAKVITNTVNNVTARMWAIVMAAGIAEARSYPGIIIVDENPVACRKILQDLETGILDGKTELEVLAKKLKELMSKVEIRIASGDQKALFEVGGKEAKGEAKKLAVKMFEQAKREKRAN